MSSVDLKAKDSPLSPAKTITKEFKSPSRTEQKPEFDTVPPRKLSHDSLAGSPNKIKTPSRLRNGRRRGSGKITKHNQQSTNSNNINGNINNVISGGSHTPNATPKKKSNNNETSVSLSTPPSQSGCISRESSNPRSRSTSFSSLIEFKDNDILSRVFPSVPVQTATFDPPLAPPSSATSAVPSTTTSSATCPSPRQIAPSPSAIVPSTTTTSTPLHSSATSGTSASPPRSPTTTGTGASPQTVTLPSSLPYTPPRGLPDINDSKSPTAAPPPPTITTSTTATSAATATAATTTADCPPASIIASTPRNAVATPAFTTYPLPPISTSIYPATLTTAATVTAPATSITATAVTPVTVPGVGTATTATTSATHPPPPPASIAATSATIAPSSSMYPPPPPLTAATTSLATSISATAMASAPTTAADRVPSPKPRLAPVRLHFESSTPNPTTNLASPTFSDKLSSLPMFGRLSRAQSNPTFTPSTSSATSTAPVCLLASLRNQMSTISPSFSSSAAPSPPSSASYSAFAALSKQQIVAPSLSSSSSQQPVYRNPFSFPDSSLSPAPSPTHASVPFSPLPLSPSASSPPAVASPRDPSYPLMWPFSTPLLNSTYSQREKHSSAPSSRASSPRPRPHMETTPTITPTAASSRTLFLVPSSSPSNTTSTASTDSDHKASRNVLLGPLFHSSSSFRASLSSLSSNFISSPTSANASPHSKISSPSFESVSSLQAAPVHNNASPPSVFSFSSLSATPTSPPVPNTLTSSTNVTSPAHVQFRTETKQQIMTGKPPLPATSAAPALPAAKGQRSGKLKKTIIGGRRGDKIDGEHSGHGESHDYSAEHFDSNEPVSFHIRSSSNTSPRSLSSMSTFSRAALQLQQATKTSPSPTARSRSISPASRNRSTSHLSDVAVNHLEPNMPALDFTEPWPLGPGLSFPLPVMLPTETDPFKEGGSTSSGSGDFDKMKFEMLKLPPTRQCSSSRADEGKVLTSPRQAVSSKDSRWTLPWDANDPMICQGYLKMVPHGMFCKFRQSKRKYCALDIRLKCFFYWKNIEQRDTGRAKCLSLVVGGSGSNEVVEMSYAGGASTVILKCESTEDAHRWLSALELLKSGRERSVSRTNSKFASSSLMDSKSLNTVTYSSPPSSREWNNERTDDVVAHTESIRNTFAAEYQKQQHVVKTTLKKQPSVTPPPPPGLNPALTIRGNLR